MKSVDKILVAYVPSPHAGYLRMFGRHRDAVLYVLGESLTKEFKPLVRNLPALEPWQVKKMLNGLGIFYTEERGDTKVCVLDLSNIDEVRQASIVIMPDEDVSRAVAEKYFAGVTVQFEDWRLRWDWGAATANRRPECETVVSRGEFDQSLMVEALGIAQKSPDWWRQIGALLVKDGKTLLAAFNTHMPAEQSAYLCGDPRSNFEPGQQIDATLAIHAEAAIIAEAARRGVAIEGCDMYITTFPCPPCANLVAKAGIKRLFYVSGYSLVAGAESLLSHGVEIVRVEMESTHVPA